MNKINKNKILQEITRFYLESSDFNGIPFNELVRRLGIKSNELSDFLSTLIELISAKKVGLLYTPTFINPHIIRMGFEVESKQIARLANPETQAICLYPLPAHLEEVVNCSKYRDEPYKLALALGSPQISPRSFDLSVLEYYRNDPRYLYRTNDFMGYICYDSDYQMAEGDQTMLERFGFSYDSELNRAVAALVRDLARLTPEHQQIWKAKELRRDDYLHPCYRDAILGEFNKCRSIFTAFVDELHLICQMTQGMNRPSLFRRDYGESGENKPRRFGFLVRPTLEEFNAFVLLLDKMISENINKKFFQKEVSYETEEERKDGKIQIRPKGTLQILDDWIRDFYSPDDWKHWDEAIQAFKEIRRKRQNPAHAIDEDVFDQKYFKEQRELMSRAYKGMKTLRMIFENYPLISHLDIKIPRYLQEGKIWKR